MRMLGYGGIVLLYAVLISCGTSSSGGYAPEARTGERHEFSLEFAGPFGGIGKGEIVERVEESETINGKSYHKVVSTVSGIPGLDEQVEYQRWATDGVYAISGSDTTKTEYLATAYPLAIGKEWTSKKPNESTHYKVVGSETVEAANETFKDCLKIEYQGDKSKGTQYLAPNLGLVKEVATASGVPMTIVLTKYKK